MRNRWAGNPLQRAYLDDLRYRARHDATYERLLADELLKEAMALAKRGRNEAAVQLLSERVELLQTDSVASSNEQNNLLIAALGVLGSILLELERLEEAESHLRKAVALAPVPTDAAAERNQSVIRASNLVHLARCRELANAPHDALGFAEQALAILRAFSESDPTVAALLHGAHTMRNRIQQKGD